MRAALFLLCLSEFFRCLLYGIVIHQNLRREIISLMCCNSVCQSDL